MGFEIAIVTVLLLPVSRPTPICASSLLNPHQHNHPENRLRANPCIDSIVDEYHKHKAD